MSRVFWITGLPGSGKTTFSRNLKSFLYEKQIKSILLDGDELRAAFQHKFGYTKEERINASRVYINIAKLLAGQGHVVLVSTVSLFNEVFEHLDKEIPTAQMIFIDAEQNLLDRRNQKQLRSSQEQSSPGVTLQVDFPKSPAIRLRGDETFDELNRIFLEMYNSIS